MALKHSALNKCKILLYLNKNTSKTKGLASCTLCSFCTAAEKSQLGSWLLPCRLMHLLHHPSTRSMSPTRSTTQNSLTSAEWPSITSRPLLKLSLKEVKCCLSLLAAPTWKSPNFHLQFLSHLWCIFHRCPFSASDSCSVFSLPAQWTSSDWKS